MNGELKLIGKRITKCRQHWGVSKYELSKLTGLEIDDIISYENDDKIPNLSDLYKMCTIFNVPCDYLIGINKSPYFSDETKADFNYITQKNIKNVALFDFSSNINEISRKITFIMELNCLSESDLAKALSITEDDILSYKHGYKMPTTEFLYKLAVTFNISSDSLIGFKKDYNYSSHGRLTNISSRILNSRLKLDLNLSEISKRTDLAISSISRYENNIRVPNADVIYKLAVALNVSSDYLIGLSDIPSKKHNISYKKLPNTNDIRIQINTRIKEESHLQYLKQKDLAKRANLSETAISRYFNGTRVPNADALYKLSIALNVSSDYLLGLNSLEDNSN